MKCGSFLPNDYYDELHVIIAGGRDFDNYGYLVSCCDRIINSYHYASINIVSGHAPGTDLLGEKYATDSNLELIVYPADWRTHGKSAGHIRNEIMAEDAHVLIAFWDGKSKGTHDMIKKALKRGLEIHVFRYHKD